MFSFIFNLYINILLNFILRINDGDKRLQALWSVLEKLPKSYFNNLRYFIKFLAKLAEHKDVNKMSSQNIAIVIAPNLIWDPHEDPNTLK